MQNEIMILHEENQEFPILGRELWQRLGIKTRYNDWFPRMCEYGFSEGEDYVEIDKPPHKDNVIELDKVGQDEFLTKMLEKENHDETGENGFCSKMSKKENQEEQENNNTSEQGRPKIKHALTLSMAKEICMLQRTEQGRKIRKYLIEVERRWKSGSLPLSPAHAELSPQLQVLIGLELKQKEQERRMDALDQHIGQVAQALESYKPVGSDWQSSMRERVVNLCSTYKLYHNEVYTTIYNRVEQSMHVNLKTRVNQKRRRMMQNDPGVKKAQIAAVTRLSCIADDPKLRVAFEKYLQELEVRHAMGGNAGR